MTCATSETVLCLDNIIDPCSKYFDVNRIKHAIQHLKGWYTEQAFDEEDLNNDWIPNDYENCHGIGIFVDALDYQGNMREESNKKILFNWFIYWLGIGPKPSTQISHITSHNYLTFRSNNDTEQMVKKIAQQLPISNIYKNPNASEESNDATMIKCKAMDIQNNNAIFLSMLDAYMRYKVNGYNNSECDSTRNLFSQKFKIETWWNHKLNQLARKIEHDLIKVGLDKNIYQTAMQTLMRRSITEMELDPDAHPVIHDSLPAFAEYTIQFQEFCISQFIRNEIDPNKNMTYTEKMHSVPIHADLWIIPQSAYDEDEEEYCEMMTSRMDEPIQDLKTYLDECRYVENKDYFIYQARRSNKDRAEGAFRELWDKYGEKQSDVLSKTHRRFIFIVDRRDKSQFTAWQEQTPNINKTNDDWCDMFYLITKCAHEIPPYYDLWPESLLALNKMFLLPLKTEKEEKEDNYVIGMDESLNGYKFVVSHHILSSNCCKRYLYFGAGAMRFELKDMKDLWPQYFADNQSLNNHADITNYLSREYNKKSFQDIKFKHLQELLPPIKEII